MPAPQARRGHPPRACYYHPPQQLFLRQPILRLLDCRQTLRTGVAFLHMFSRVDALLRTGKHAMMCMHTLGEAPQHPASELAFVTLSSCCVCQLARERSRCRQAAEILMPRLEVECSESKCRRECRLGSHLYVSLCPRPCAPGRFRPWPNFALPPAETESLYFSEQGPSQFAIAAGTWNRESVAASRC